MSDSGVHRSEMPAPRSLDERAVEAFLSGRSVAAAEVGELSSFVEDLKVVVSGPPPVPTPDLAGLLRSGISANAPLPQTVAVAAPSQGGVTAPGRKPRRSKMTVSKLLAAIAAKLSGLGLAAKAALALGLTAATATTAGAIGVLPDAAQHAVATVVNAGSPVHIPDVTDGTDASTTTTTSTTKAVTDPVTNAVGSNPAPVGGLTGTGGDPLAGDDQGQPDGGHGACVSAVAKSAPTGAGGVHGRATSAAAKACPKGADARDETPTSSSTTTTVAPPTGGADTGSQPGVHQDGPGHGQGHGEGADRGSSGSHGQGH